MELFGAWLTIQAFCILGYAAGKAGEKVGKAINRKRLGKYSPYSEIITVKRGSALK